VRHGDGLGRRIRGIFCALLALVALLWIAAFVRRVRRGFRGLVFVRLDIHEPGGLGIVGCGGRGGRGRGGRVGVREGIVVRGVARV
jgi:hypothetical protein